MKVILEGEFGPEIGTVAVTRGGDCHGYNWRITFKTFGGDVETMEVVETSADLETSVSVVTIQEGGVIYGPLTSDFLQLKKESPQVRLSLNITNNPCHTRDKISGTDEFNFHFLCFPILSKIGIWT